MLLSRQNSCRGMTSCRSGSVFLKKVDTGSGLNIEIKIHSKIDFFILIYMDKSFIIKYQYLNDMDFYAVIKSYGVNFIRFDPNPDFEGLSGLIVKITPCASLPTSPLFFYLEDFCQRNLVLVRFFSLHSHSIIISLYIQII